MTTSGDETAAPVRAGSHEVFAAIFDAYAPDVFRFLARRCRARAVAVDGTLRPWLFGIATNVLRNAARASRRHAAALARFHAAGFGDVVPDIADDAVRGVDESRDRAALGRTS